MKTHSPAEERNQERGWGGGWGGVAGRMSRGKGFSSTERELPPGSLRVAVRPSLVQEPQEGWAGGRGAEEWLQNLIPVVASRIHRHLRWTWNEKEDFLGGPVVKNLPGSAGDASSIPHQETKIPHVVGQLSPHGTTRETSHHEETSRTPQLRPKAAKLINTFFLMKRAVFFTTQIITMVWSLT